MSDVLGNSGAPRWYDCSRSRFDEYLELLTSCQATAAEIVLHDGDADAFTSRVHVLREDWEHVCRGYIDRGLQLFLHGPLTPEFSGTNWAEDPEAVVELYQPVFDQVAEIAQAQGRAHIVFHAVADQSASLDSNERATAGFLRAIVEELERRTNDFAVSVELRAFRPVRPTVAATSRESVLRILDLTGDPRVGVCWDVAHDIETSAATGEAWEMPSNQFISRVLHLHLHDIGDDGEPHCPLFFGRVPVREAMALLPDVPAIMEIRWRMAERIGVPWEVLAECYDRVREQSDRPATLRPNTRS